MSLRSTESLRPHPVSLAIYGDEAPDETLVASIAASGVLVPLAIKGDGTIISGHRRHAAAIRAGCADVPVVVVSFADELDERQAIIEHNRQREKTLTQRMREADELHRIETERAKERMRAGGGDQKSGRAKLPDPIVADGALVRTEGGIFRGRARDKVAESVGMKPRTFDKAAALWQKAKAGDERALKAFDAIDSQKSTVHTEFKAVVQADRKADQIAKVEAASALPDGLFHVIAADPPWAYEKRAGDVTHRADCPYPTMTIQEIVGLAVAERAADDCVLWLWTTNAFMEQAYDVARAWGFEVKTILTWVKDRMGTGDWLRGQTEHCLMAVKGRPVVSLTNQTTVLHGKVREHSRKPDEFYALVESLCHGRRCELFARESRDGWEAFGAEVGKFEAA